MNEYPFDQTSTFPEQFSGDDIRFDPSQQRFPLDVTCPMPEQMQGSKNLKISIEKKDVLGIM